MAIANYDHPAYTARLMFSMGVTTAGASGTSGICSFPSAMRLRNASVTVRTAGTSATSGNKVDIYNGTTSVGTVTLGSSTAGVVGTSGDMNSTLAAGALLSLKNGTDATGVAHVVIEMHIDPAGTFTG